MTSNGMKKIILAALALAPAFAFAQLTNVESLVTAMGRIVTTAIPIVFCLIVIAFFWGLVKFIFSQGDESAKTDAKKIMLWSIIAMFVAASIWGLVIFIRTSLGVSGESNITIPTIR